ncbi:MAG: diguanylate cyclase [Planctomycetota bacterium]|nr:diguanylate cyclase [Planctomycetota bacterium]
MSPQASVLAIVSESPEFSDFVAKFEMMGLEVHSVPDCLAAMGAVKADEFNFVVLADVPGPVDVADTTRLLKSLRTDQYLPVVVVTSSTSEAGRRRDLLAAGVDDLLTLDTDEDTLWLRLQPVLRLKNVSDQLRHVQGELARTLERENTLLRQLREDNKTLKVRSITDGLTALYNYRYLMEWMKTEFKISRRYGHDLSMVIVDIDFFKRVNDENGHPFGDLVLKEIAVILKRCSRESDLVARYAGDEFAIICPRSGRKDVQALARRILTACRKHDFVCGERHVPITLSLGTATYPEDAEVVSPEMLMFLADQALYQTKRQGRNSTTSWHEIDPQTRLAIRRELHGAGNPLLADDPKSRLELAAAARLVEPPAEVSSHRPPSSDAPSASDARPVKPMS